MRILLAGLALAACAPRIQAADSSPTPPEPTPATSPCLEGEDDLGPVENMALPELKTEGAVIHVLRSTPFGPNTVVTITNRDGWVCGTMEALDLFDMPSDDPTV